MKKIIILGVFILSTSLVFGVDSEALRNNMKNFCLDLEESVISATVNQNVYADAYIGKFIPSVPPHFGLGINSSFTKLNLDELKNAANELNLSNLNSLSKKMYLPLITIDARIGGLLLPFDMGASFMKLNFNPLGIDYQTFGVDIRIPILKQGLIAPNIALGAAYYKTSVTINPKDELFVNLDMNAISFNAQVSKDIFFITPFIGGRYVINKSDYSYKAEKNLIKVSDEFSSTFKDNNSIHVYGGLSFNIFIIPITAAVSYDIDNKILSGICSVRLQI